MHVNNLPINLSRVQIDLHKTLPINPTTHHPILYKKPPTNLMTHGLHNPTQKILKEPHSPCPLVKGSITQINFIKGTPFPHPLAKGYTTQIEIWKEKYVIK
jgi:hypothetical protein